MDERAGPGVKCLVELAVALVESLDRQPVWSPTRAQTEAESARRRSPGARIVGLLAVVAAVAVLGGCAPAIPPTTGTAGPVAPASPAAEAPPAAAQPPQTPAPGPVASVLYADGMAITKTGTVTVDVGSRVTLRVVSDVADEVHLHGYERRVDAAPGQEVGLSFAADTPGLFKVELENAQAELIEVEVV